MACTLKRISFIECEVPQVHLYTMGEHKSQKRELKKYYYIQEAIQRKHLKKGKKSQANTQVSNKFNH